jgi:hypothetical protein
MERSLTNDKWGAAKQMCAHLNDGEIALVEQHWSGSSQTYYGHFLQRCGNGWLQFYTKIHNQPYQFSCLAEELEGIQFPL